MLGAVGAKKLATRFGLTGRVDLYHAFVKAMTMALRGGGWLGLLTSNRFFFQFNLALPFGIGLRVSFSFYDWLTLEIRNYLKPPFYLPLLWECAGLEWKFRIASLFGSMRRRKCPVLMCGTWILS